MRRFQSGSIIAKSGKNGPTIIGLIAEVTSLPIAFAFPVLLYMVVGLQSKYIKVRSIKQ